MTCNSRAEEEPRISQVEGTHARSEKPQCCTQRVSMKRQVFKDDDKTLSRGQNKEEVLFRSIMF